MKKLIFVFFLCFLSFSFAASAKLKTLLIVSHPYPQSSFFIKNLEEAARSVENVTIRNLESLYGFDTRAIDREVETKLMRECDRVVFMYPTHWFNLTPMMKAYLNEIWGSVGPGLWSGKQMLVVTTAGGGNSTYGKNARTKLTMDEILAPMRASAAHAGMVYLEPLYFLGVSSSEINDYKAKLIKRLSE